ncbi:NAD(+)/NADH kinase [Pendulispora albinea]|uniref:NAD(+)/NADH kinase n=1 Tax=Pendulispora albinea TaxID=2741071 RepID=A0ABZ2MBP6_9BACT
MTTTVGKPPIISQPQQTPPKHVDAPNEPRRVLVLAKRTSYRTFVEEQKDAKIRELLDRGDPTVMRLRKSHEAHEETMQEVTSALSALGAEVTVQIGPRAPFRCEGLDLVLTVGGDGTLLAASHQVGPGVPLLGVNSAPESSVGFFCAAAKGSVLEALRGAFDGTLPKTELARMQVELNDRCIHKRVLNELLFCHSCPAATTRYILRLTHPNGEFIEEDQRSSGLWIGPPAGSTAAQRSAGGNVLPLSSKRLQFVVREAYVRLGGSLRLPMGLVEDGGTVSIHCKIREGKAFLDGLHIVHDVGMGDRLVMRRSDETLTVLGLTRRDGS